MKITLIIPVRKMAKYNIEASKEYIKRLSRYCHLKIIKTKTETEAIKKTPTTSYIIGISHTCETISSEFLAKIIADLGISSMSSITFVLTNDEVFLNTCNLTIALSSMPLSTDLESVVLLEQIYRSYRIIYNQAYHK